MNQEQVLAGLLQRQRLVKSEMRTVNALIEEQPCSGCGQPLDTSEPRGCEACEGRFCWRDGCLTAYNDGADGTLHFCAAHAPTQPPPGHEGIEPKPLSSGRMRPRLICLTGPCAVEVSEVFRPGCTQQEGLNYRDLETGEPKHTPTVKKWWDEVRDFSAVIWEMVYVFYQHIDKNELMPRKEVAKWIDPFGKAVMSKPGGEAWLVGLVLPECPLSPDLRRSENWTPWQHAKVMRWGVPARLAILAPEPPPLLVERVNAWGGEQWICNVRDEASQAGVCWIARPDGKTFWGHTWPEAVRAALGEM